MRRARARARASWHGIQDEYCAMVMEMLGPSLDDLLVYCGGTFSLKTVLMLADQMIQRLAYLHTRHIIHRDIKPENFLMGLGSKTNIVYLIDYGLCKRYRDPHTKLHEPYREDRSLTGTARYASINAHVGVEQSRRDDLESLGYVLIYFLHGKLPWQGLQADTRKQKYERIKERKRTVPVDALCVNLPEEFGVYVKYTRALKFDETPDYDYLRRMFTVRVLCCSARRASSAV